MSMNNLRNNTTMLEEILTIAENLPDKSEGGSSGENIETCTIMITFDKEVFDFECYFTCFNNGVITITSMSEHNYTLGGLFDTVYTYTIPNVVKNSMFIMYELYYAGLNNVSDRLNGDIIYLITIGNSNSIALMQACGDGEVNCAI